MTTQKRAHYNVDVDLPTPKRLKTGSGGDRPFGQNPGQLDPLFGQRSVLPDSAQLYSSDSDHENEGLNYGDGEESEESRVQREAFEYLRSVRVEATSIPPILSSRMPQSDDNEDIGGYYEDGAYTAAPSSSRTSTEYPWLTAERLAAQPILPRDAYFSSLLNRFTSLRTQLLTPIPPSASRILSRHHAVHMGASARDWTTWRWRVKSTDPHPTQLARMNKSTVLRLLRVCTKEMSGGSGREKGLVTGRLARWIMGLLARLPDRGELGSEEIGIVRELGKRAVYIGVRIKGVHDLSALEEEGEEGDADEEEPIEGGEDDVVDVEVEEELKDSMADAEPFTLQNEDASLSQEPEEDIEAVRARVLAQLNTGSANINTANKVTPISEQGTMENTRVILDMILTVAGELYGQRDLLEFREEWP